MAISDYFLLMAIGGYFLLMTIDGYFINGYQMLFYK